MKARFCKFLLCVLFAALLAASGAAGTVCASAADAVVRMPVVMYHDFTTDPNDPDSMTVHGAHFRLDMALLRVFE